MSDEGFQQLMASIDSVEEKLVSALCLDYVFIALQVIIMVLLVTDQVCTISIKEHYLLWFKQDKPYSAQKDDVEERDCRV